MSAESRRARSPFYKMIDDLAEELRNSDNRFDLGDITSTLAGAIAGDPAMLEAWAFDQAALMVDRHDRSKRPRPGELFPDLSWAPVVENIRVQVGKLSRPQMQLWGEIDKKEFDIQAEAYQRKKELRDGWLQKWLLPEYRHCKELRELWKLAYGWSPPPPAPPPIIEPPTP